MCAGKRVCVLVSACGCVHKCFRMDTGEEDETLLVFVLSIVHKDGGVFVFMSAR